MAGVSPELSIPFFCSEKKLLDWITKEKQYAKTFLIKFKDGASDCGIPNACSIPLHPVGRGTLRFFIVIASSPTVANAVIPYYLTLTEAERAMTPFLKFVNHSSVRRDDHAFVEIPHPIVAARAQQLTKTKIGTYSLMFFSSSFDKTGSVLPTEYLYPIQILDTIETPFEVRQKAYQHFHDTFVTKKSVQTTKVTPSKQDKTILERYVSFLVPHFSTFLREHTKYSTSGRTYRLAGEVRVEDLFGYLEEYNTPEGRNELKNAPQKDPRWKFWRVLCAITASRLDKAIGHGHAENHKVMPGFQSEQSANYTDETEASMSSLIEHPNRFDGNDKTAWGNLYEDGLLDLVTLRQRMREIIVNHFEGTIDVENVGLEKLPNHTTYGVSTDSNIYMRNLLGLLLVMVNELKNPTFAFTHGKCEYVSQVYLQEFVKGAINGNLCVGSMLHGLMLPIDYFPEYMERFLFVRMLMYTLYCYYPSLLYSLNYGAIPPWLPPCVKREEGGQTPSEVYAKALQILEENKDDFFIPLKDDGIHVKDYQLQNLPEDKKRFETIRQEHWHSSWQPEKMWTGKFSALPFLLPVSSEEKEIRRKRRLDDMESEDEEDEKEGEGETKEEDTTCLSNDSLSSMDDDCVMNLFASNPPPLKRTKV